MIKQCVLCKTEFSADKAWDKRKRRFCSSACLRKAVDATGFHKPPKRLVVSLCQTCGNEFFAFPSQKKKFCSRSCWKSKERRHLEKGYVILRHNKHVGRVREHVVIAEQALGRKLKPNEVVHHFNMVKADNRRSNLLICDVSYHSWLHQQYERRFVELRIGRSYV